MGYRVFYCCDSTGDKVEASAAIAMDRDTIVSTAMQVLRNEGDFFGVIDDSAVTLQFMVEAGNKLWMEIPVPKKGGSRGKHIGIDDVESILLSLPESITPSAFPDMRFESWT